MPLKSGCDEHEITDRNQRDIEVGYSAVVANIERIRQTARERDVATGGDVERLRPGKAGVELDAVRESLFNRRLERVIRRGAKAAVLKYLREGRVGADAACGRGCGRRVKDARVQIKNRSQVVAFASHIREMQCKVAGELLVDG